MVSTVSRLSNPIDDNLKELPDAFETIATLHDRIDQDRLSVSLLIVALGVHAYPAGIFFFAALNVIPAPPGTSLFLGLPLFILSLRKLIGAPFWLPGFMMRMPLRKATIDRFQSRVTPHLASARKYLNTNAPWLGHPYARGPIDFLMLILALSVLVPLPFTAMFPAACICILSLGMMLQDIRWVAFGVATGLLALLVVWAVTYGSTRLLSLLY